MLLKEHECDYICFKDGNRDPYVRTAKLGTYRVDSNSVKFYRSTENKSKWLEGPSGIKATSHQNGYIYIWRVEK